VRWLTYQGGGSSMKWFQRKTQKQTTHNEPFVYPETTNTKSAIEDNLRQGLSEGIRMSENPNIPQVINGENLLSILKLWHEFSDWRKQSPPQIVTGILAKMVGLIMNDTISDSASIINSSPINPSPPYTTLVLTGEHSLFLRIRLYDSGITIDQLSGSPSHEEIIRDPQDWVYHTIITHQVEGTTKLLTFLYQQRIFVFVYGTQYFKEPCTNRKIYISASSTNPTNFDAFLIVKDRYANSSQDTINWEFLWSNGDIYAMQQPINKNFKPNLSKVEKSLL
jgi:hypothetical protein